MKKSVLTLILVLLAPALVTSIYAQEYASAPSAPLTSQPSFAELQTHPEAYQGQEIILGGQVIAARQDGDTTQLEIMQLPLGEKGASQGQGGPARRTEGGQGAMDDQGGRVQSGPEKNAPEANQALTQGRFLAFQKSGLSAAVISPGDLVTVVGQVAGSAVTDPSQTNVLYPVLEVKTLTVWSQPATAQLPPPAVGQPPYPMQPAYPPPPPVLGTPPVESNYYYTQYWDPGLAIWYWRPFWVYPWWTRPVVVVPPRVAIIRPHAVPFGHGPRIHHFVPRDTRLPHYIVPPIGHSHVFPPPAPRSAPYIVPPIGHPRTGQPSINSAPREGKATRPHGHQGGRDSRRG